jgi:hypothetical protein
MIEGHPFVLINPRLPPKLQSSPVTGATLPGTNGTANGFLHNGYFGRVRRVCVKLFGQLRKKPEVRLQHQLFATTAPGGKGDHQRASESEPRRRRFWQLLRGSEFNPVSGSIKTEPKLSVCDHKSIVRQ